jgi:hypothetical protein
MRSRAFQGRLDRLNGGMALHHALKISTIEGFLKNGQPAPELSIALAELKGDEHQIFGRLGFFDDVDEKRRHNKSEGKGSSLFQIR